MRKNKITYQQALAMLREHTYEAPNNWEMISERLDLNQQLDTLPKYKAPDHLWNGIEDELDNTKEAPINQDKRHSNQVRVASMIIIFLLSIIAYLLITRPAAVDSNFEYRSEIDVTAPVASNDLKIDENLNEVYMYIQANEFIFSEEELEKFKLHLAELQSAIDAIEEMKKNYGQDEHMNKILARIERDKSKLLKAMIAATS